MTGKLIIGQLNIQSSYIQNVELPSENGFDTVQIWIDSERSWRIRTYFIDHDIHIHEVDLEVEPVDFWNGHLARVYGDVLESVRCLSFNDATDKIRSERF